jgi:hypothetical protein
MVWAGLLKVLIEMVCFLIVFAFVVSHGCKPLRTLLAPLLAALGTLLGVLDSNVKQHLLVADWGHLPAAWGRVMFSHLIAGGVLCGDAAQLLGGVPESVTVLALAWVPHAAFGL